MRIRNWALAACLLCAGSSLAQHHYTVKKGDTLSGIAHKLGVSERRLSEANDLSSQKRLKVGRKLVVPSDKHKAHHEVASTSGYKVRAGDNDESIARKFHVSAREIRRMNPDIRWSALRIGRSIHVPGEHGSAVAEQSSKRSKASSGSYVVRAGDNDQKIAKKAGVSLKSLRKVNPGVRWNALQIGHKIKLPGGTVVASREEPARIKSHYAKIASDNVNVRRAPGKRASLVTTVDSGTRVAILEHDGDWYKVRFPRGTKGWVRGDFLEATHVVAMSTRKSKKQKGHLSSRLVASLERGPIEGGEDLVSRARGMRGTPYSYGSSSRHATDCSGFALQVYGSAGYKLPRTSKEQSGVGKAVHRSELRPGDLVFFHTRGSSRVNHVGIYEGNGKFIHASSGKGQVTESSLDEGYYQKRFAGARRVLHGKPKKATRAVHHVDPKHSLGPDEE